MPYNDVTCKCGEEVEIFISQSADIEEEYKECPTCERIIIYESPAGEGVKVTDFAREVGEFSK